MTVPSLKQPGLPALRRTDSARHWPGASGAGPWANRGGQVQHRWSSSHHSHFKLRWMMLSVVKDLKHKKSDLLIIIGFIAPTETPSQGSSVGDWESRRRPGTVSPSGTACPAAIPLGVPVARLERGQHRWAGSGGGWASPAHVARAVTPGCDPGP